MKVKQRAKLVILMQICQLIPPRILHDVITKLKQELAEKNEKLVRPRRLSFWSHIISLIYLHLSNSESLNDVCDTFNWNRGEINKLRNTTAPLRNTLSYANRTRSSEIIKRFFFAVVDYYRKLYPEFFKCNGRRYLWFPKRFKRVIRAIDSTVIELTASCMDWAKHRKEKAAAKVHVGIDVESFLPVTVVVSPARDHDSKYMMQLCEKMKPGEIAVFDRAYLTLLPLNAFTEKGIYWVTRCKKTTRFRIVKVIEHENRPDIKADYIVEWDVERSRELYPRQLRYVKIEIRNAQGEKEILDLMTNNFKWSPRSIGDLYRCRWAIETFFKEMKQTLGIKTFIGFNRNAIEWQIWSAFLAYFLLRLEGWLNNWQGSFKHLASLAKGLLWNKQSFDNIVLNYRYWTGKGRRASPIEDGTPFLKGFEELRL